MKMLKYELCEQEFNRYISWVTGGFMSPANQDRNFIFKDKDGEFHVLRHGLISAVSENSTKGKAYCMSSFSEIYSWAINHSNMVYGDKLNLHMCYCGLIKNAPQNQCGAGIEFINIVNDTQYPELIGADDGTENAEGKLYAEFGIINSEEDLDEAAAIVGDVVYIEAE